MLDRLSLGVQHSLYFLDDVIATGQEELEKFDMCLKRHQAKTRAGGPLIRRKKRLQNHVSIIVPWPAGGAPSAPRLQRPS